MIILLLAFLLSNQSYAVERHLLYLGGGGEPSTVVDDAGVSRPNTTTIFDKGLTDMGAYLKANTWQSDVRFDGGHSQTESILATQFAGSKSRGLFDEASFEFMINDYVNRLKNGDIKSGEQLMVVIDTHGAIHIGSELSHQVAAGGTTVSLDSLQTLVDLAKKKGVKLAILDMSCHSGNSLRLANDNTCVITASGPNHYGDAAFIEEFIANMKPGLNLEEVFLAARKGSNSPSFPMISTNVGTILNDRLYESLTPFFYYKNAETHADLLSDYLLNTAQSAGGACTAENNPATRLIDQINQLQSVIVHDKTMDHSALDGLVKIYFDQQQEIVKSLRALGAASLKNKETFKCQVRYGKNQAKVATVETHYTWQEIMQFESFADSIQWLKDQKKDETVAEDIASDQAGIDCLQKVALKRRALELAHPELLTYPAKSKELIDSVAASYDSAYWISVEANKLYERYYVDLAAEEKATNACADFKI